MQKGKDLRHDLDRLIAASSMFARQQSERTTFGDDEDYDDAKEETHRVVAQVLDTLEKNLDEDFVEQLDRGEYPRTVSAIGGWPRLPDLRSTWPYSMWPYWHYSVYRGRMATRPLRRATGRTHDMLDEILGDFRADFEDRLKRARREDRALSDQELDEALQGLREDLSVVVRRSRRREDRREEAEEDSHTRRRRTEK